MHQGRLELFSRYLRRVELSRRVGKACRGKGIRSDYGSVRLVLVLVGMLLVGARRLEHLQYVCDDPMLLRFCGLRRLPSRPTIVNWLKQFTGERLKGLSELNGVLVHEQIERLGLNRSDGRYGRHRGSGKQSGWMGVSRIQSSSCPKTQTNSRPAWAATSRCLGAQLAISVHKCPVLTDSRFPMSIFKRTQRKYVKKAYRVRNWREYEAGLRNRGSLTVWISLTAGKLVNWDAPRPRRRKPGRQRKYSNHAIETAVTLGMVFHLSSRQSEGLLRSLFALMKLDNDVPDHTTISRRKAKLGKVPFYQVKQKTPLHILIDKQRSRCPRRPAAQSKRAGTIASSICVSTSRVAKSSPAS